MAKLNPNLTIHVYDRTINGKAFLRDFVLEFMRLCFFKGSLKKLFVPMTRFFIYREFFKSNNGRYAYFRERIYNRVELPNDATIDRVFKRLQDKPNILLKMDI